MTTLSDQDFRVKSDEALQAARRALLPLADQEGFEVEFSGDTLNPVERILNPPQNHFLCKTVQQIVPDIRHQSSRRR